LIKEKFTGPQENVIALYGADRRLRSAAGCNEVADSVSICRPGGTAVNITGLVDVVNIPMYPPVSLGFIRS
jgi:hypothetical protein